MTRAPSHKFVLELCTDYLISMHASVQHICIHLRIPVSAAIVNTLIYCGVLLHNDLLGWNYCDTSLLHDHLVVLTYHVMTGSTVLELSYTTKSLENTFVGSVFRGTFFGSAKQLSHIRETCHDLLKISHKSFVFDLNW